jgi:hypothetical protein
VLAALVWVLSLQGVPIREMTDIGLLSVLPPAYYIALGILTISFIATVMVWPDQKVILFLQIGLLILILHGTPAILYGTPRYAWAWKHAGIVDYILRHQRVDPNIPFLTAYHNWPGFFALNAFLVQAAGLKNALVFARWAPVFFNFAFFGGLFLIYHGLTADRRLIWMSIWFFFLTCWVGQDYFAPQAFGYFLYLVALGILLLWFRTGSQPEGKPLLVQERLKRLVSSLGDWFRKAERIEVKPPRKQAQYLMLIAIVIILMVVITISHQLTPVMIISALVFLTLFRRVYPRSLVGLMIVLECAWLFFIAFGFVGDSLEFTLSSFGAVETNVSGNLINLTQASPGQVLVALMGRGLTLLVVVLAIIGFFWRLYKRHFDLIPVLLILTPLTFLFANSYSGESLFRVYFFALPSLAFFIGGLIFSSVKARTTWVSVSLASTLSIVMLIGFLFAYYGKEKVYYFTPEEIAATQFVLESAPPGSLIVLGTRNSPNYFKNYENFTYVPISQEPIEVRREILDRPVEVISRWMGNVHFPAAYLIVTKTQKADIEMVGDLPAGALERIEAALIQSGQFVAIYQNRDAAVYSLRVRGE